ncbi:MAG TPA: hypothetical protein VFQ43_00250, partial [Nitrososphaera sp.]|nr:hypothetical protein [Nitrososphaera sp.]
NNLLCRWFKRMRCRLYGHARCFHTTLFDFCLTVKGSTDVRRIASTSTPVTHCWDCVVVFQAERIRGFRNGLGDGIRT